MKLKTKIAIWILRRIVQKESPAIRYYLKSKILPDLKRRAEKTENPYDDELVNLLENVLIGM